MARYSTKLELLDKAWITRLLQRRSNKNQEVFSITTAAVVVAAAAAAVSAILEIVSSVVGAPCI